MVEKFKLVFQALFLPREVYRKIQANAELDASLLLVVVTALTGVVVKVLNSGAELKILLKILVFVGALAGAVITTVLMAHLLGWVSNIFKKGDEANSIRLALPYSFVPSILGNLLTLIVPAQSHGLINIGAGIWSFIILAFLLAEIKNFTVIKGALTTLFSILIFALPFFLVIVSVSLFRGS